LILNWLVAGTKLSVGLLTNTVSLIADGFHSLVDGLSNVVALVAQNIADQPPDHDHPYGHRRYEAIATLFIGGFLFLAAWEVLQAALGSLISGAHPAVNRLQFLALGFTLVVNILVVVYEKSQARRLGSALLAADSEHTLTDVLVSLAVLAGLLLVQAGLAWADAAVALLIVLLILRMGFKIVGQSIQVLSDRAPLAAEQIAAALGPLPQVEGVRQIRSRGAGDDVRVDMVVDIPSAMTADHAQSLSESIQAKVKSLWPQVAEVQVNFHSQATPRHQYALRARAVADSLGLSVHEVNAIPQTEGVILEMHVEVERGLSLRAAHQQVSRLEARLSAESDIQGVISHIEPAQEGGSPPLHSAAAVDLRERALVIAQGAYPAAQWRGASIRLAPGGYAWAVHCLLDGQTSVEEAHQIAEEAETRIRADLPAIRRVTIHTEPLEELSKLS
jgi:cation diffusion facilitator family transporter